MLTEDLLLQGALLQSSTVPCSFSPLTSRIYSFLFSVCKRTDSSKFFDTQVSSVSTEEFALVVVVVVTPPFPRDGGTARTAIKVHAVNLIELV